MQGAINHHRESPDSVLQRSGGEGTGLMRGRAANSGRPQRPRPDGFDERAPFMTTQAMRKEWACGNDSILRWLAEIGIKRPKTRAADIPDGFAEVASTWTSAALQRHFNLSEHVVLRMRKALGIDVRHRGTAIPIPDGFAAAARCGIAASVLAERFGVSVDLARRWRTKLGIVIKPGHRSASPARALRAPSARGEEDIAAEHLRRFCPVYRCREDGRADARGRRWRCGVVVLTGADLIARAKRKGFDPDAWRRLG